MHDDNMLDDNVKKLADDANFAAVTTLLPDGTPMTHPMWVDHDDRHLLVNTEVERQKFKNIERDPRVTVTIWRPDSPYQYVEVRGRVIESIAGEEARRHIDELSRKYTGGDYAGEITSDRVILKIAPERQSAKT